MQCPNPQCNNRALQILAACEAAVQFNADGRTIALTEHGEWVFSDTSQAHCPRCGWIGRYADCKEPDDVCQGDDPLP